MLGRIYGLILINGALRDGERFIFIECDICYRYLEVGGYLFAVGTARGKYHGACDGICEIVRGLARVGFGAERNGIILSHEEPVAVCQYNGNFGFALKYQLARIFRHALNGSGCDCRYRCGKFRIAVLLGAVHGEIECLRLCHIAERKGRIFIAVFVIERIDVLYYIAFFIIVAVGENIIVEIYLYNAAFAEAVFLRAVFELCYLGSAEAENGSFVRFRGDIAVYRNLADERSIEHTAVFCGFLFVFRRLFIGIENICYHIALI